MMARNKKPYKECKITEDTVALLLRRYSPIMIIEMLHEIAHFVGNGTAKIDWDTLVKKSSTGISNPREYQMLWRHLAYGHPLLDSLLDDCQPLDDDSDLECEAEASPSISYDSSSDAVAVVKVLMASGFPMEKNDSMIEAPLTISVPTCKSAPLPRLNISVPVLLQKQPLSGPAATIVDHLEKNGFTEASNKKKRKNWTKDEDIRLYKAVRKHGTGNWAAIATEANFDRTATQLSQRWAHIRRKNKDLGEMESECSNHLSEAQQAARHAMNLALDPPSKNSILNNSGVPSFSRIVETPANQQATRQNIPVPKIKPPSAPDTCPKPETTPASSSAPPVIKADPHPLPSPAVSIPTYHHPLHPPSTSKPIIIPNTHPTRDRHDTSSSSDKKATDTTPHASSSKPASVSVSKPHLIDRSKQLGVKPALNSDPVRAAAVAAGARIATASDAASLIKAAQAKNAVHIIATGAVKQSPPSSSGPVLLKTPMASVAEDGAAADCKLASVASKGDTGKMKQGDGSVSKETKVETNGNSMENANTLVNGNGGA